MPVSDEELGELTDDAIAGGWRVWQRRRGHRYSLDDLVTAWEAARACPGAARYADLGCGLGSVLLMVTHKLSPEARIAAIEAQAISAELARRNLARNHLEARVSLVQGDLRDPELLARMGGARFDLVTGTPPYLAPGSASPSTDAQRTYARIEMRGGIEAYLEAAARVLAPEGRFVVCCDARRPDRALDGGRAASLVPVRRRDVVPREGHPALFTVWTFGRLEAPCVEEPPLIARDAAGGRTRIAHDLRRFFDLPVNEAEPPSP